MKSWLEWQAEIHNSVDDIQELLFLDVLYSTCNEACLYKK